MPKTTPNPASCTVRLPFPPSVNSAWRVFGNRLIISKSGRDYRETIAALVAEMEQQPFTGPLTVELWLVPKTRRKYDVDNFTKTLFDSLTKANFWEDDEQVYELIIHKYPRPESDEAERGFVLMTVEPTRVEDYYA